MESQGRDGACYFTFAYGTCAPSPQKSYYAYLIGHTSETWMERDAVVARKLISPGDTVLDIGANIGVYSRMLSRCVGPQGTVYAFEPIPHTFDFLSNNIRKLGLKNV